MHSSLSASRIVAIGVAFAWLLATIARADESEGLLDAEVRVVGVYEGIDPADGKPYGPRSRIEIDRPGKELVLVLGAETPVTWEVSLKGSTRVKKVILNGVPEQAVAGLPEGTPVEKSEQYDRFTGHLYRNTGQAFVPFIAGLSRRVESSPPESDLGRPRSERPVVVESIQDDLMIVLGHPQPTPIEDLPKIAGEAAEKVVFGAHYYSGREVSFGEHTLLGPNRDKLQPLPKDVKRVAFDPETKECYGIVEDGFAIVDLKKNTFERIDADPDLPPFERLNEITFDTKRKRVILAAKECMYAFAPATGKWSILAHRSAPLQALAYSPYDDRVYGITVESNETGIHYFLGKMNANCVLLDRTELGPNYGHRPQGNAHVSVMPGSGAGAQSVVPLDGYVAIITYVHDDRPPRHSFADHSESRRIYLIDTESGKTYWTLGNP